MARSTTHDQRIIRPARTRDAREVTALYDVCLRTGADGKDASPFVQDPLLLGEVYLGAYLALEPELAFVVTAPDDAPLGYVVGASDTVAFEDELEKNWWPALREQYPLGTFPEGSRDERLVQMMHSPSRMDRELITGFPAHLHVDLLPDGQGGGNGRHLMETLFDALRARGVEGVHLGVSRENERAIGFYRHLGFTPLHDDGVFWGLKL